MATDKKNIDDRKFAASLTKLLATFFYAGYFPLIPGTFGSFIAVLIFFALKDNPLAYILFTSCILLLGFFVGTEAEVIFKRKDPPYVVIDEVGGMLLSLLSLLFFKYDLLIIVAGFLLFRLLDTLKPYPAHQFERLPAGAGIMLDDIVAAVYTNVVLQVVLRSLSHTAS